ncbi:hypothetical protein OCU04_012469 [Sclerotinia nivalis]|uniref:GPCPD1-like C2 domain-containing protein n=1 Tax=Sclerotinia nivalis TaxID=352851 RepID=A0A9X0DDA0_9HELO|nr:hypothetical protein OCU04_012469 [Sclerotinia nivalis]
MRLWYQLDTKKIRAAVFSTDLNSHSPLYLSIVKGHLEVTKVLLHICGNDHNDNSTAFSSCLKTAFNEPLLFAVRSNLTEALILLLDLDININCHDAVGQTPLYLAALYGNKIIIDIVLSHAPLLNKPEVVKHWTPLIVASIYGFRPITEILIKHGANIAHKGILGWTAIDYACYHGNTSLAQILSKATGDLSEVQATEIQHRLKTRSNERSLVRKRSRRHLITDENHIVVNLGSLDTSASTPAVCLSPHLFTNPFLMHPESMFSLKISLVGKASPSYTISLPLLEDAIEITWTFSTIDRANMKLSFEVFQSNPDIPEGQELIGRGISLLDSSEQARKAKRESISRACTIPIHSLLYTPHASS